MRRWLKDVYSLPIRRCRSQAAIATITWLPCRSGGYRTGPYAPADYRPDVEVHTTEGDLFYVIDGRSTQVLGGTVIGGRETAPG